MMERRSARSRLRVIVSALAGLGVLLLTVYGLGNQAAPEQLIGTRCPEWGEHTWINSQPLKLADLRGKVVLIRFFTDTACPYCGATAPALNEFHAKYAPTGLVVIGMYTPKPRPAPRSVDQVKKIVSAYRFKFPVALDNDWVALRRLWLDRVPEATFTSASLLIDKRGVVRYAHPGGEYSPSSKDSESRRSYDQVKKMIETLLAEP